MSDGKAGNDARIQDTERALHESEERFRRLSEAAFEGIVISERGVVIDANRQLAEMLGCGLKELIGRHAMDFVAPESRELVRARMEAGDESRYEHLVVKEDGTKFLVEVRGKMIPYDGKKLRVTAIRDIQKRRNRERELQESQQQFRDLVARMVEIREEERGTMAREIHDVLGQSLSALRIDLAWIKGGLSSRSPEIGERVREMVANLDSTLDTMRELSTRLRPSVLDDLGLAAAIDWQVSELARRTEIRCALFLGEEGIEMDRGRDIAIFRVLQEALTNVTRHAGATEIRVCLRREEGDLILEVEDNGKGASMEDLSGHRALGILGMRERARGLGGVVMIRRGSENGTVVILRVPVDGPAPRS